MPGVRLALAQLNATVGDLPGNERKIADAIAAAKEAGAQLVLFPELAITGYPPEDLLFKEHFLAAARAAVDRLAALTDGIAAVIGFPERDDDVYNAAAVCSGGEVVGVYRKLRLPNYGVFDELRYFQSGTEPMVVEVDGVPVGITICEDIWVPGAPLTEEALAGARLVVNLSASPFSAGKAMQRERMLAQRARDSLCAVAFCALVGGQDELVFDGSSVVLDHRGRPIARAPQMAEHLLVCDVDTDAPAAARLKDSRPRATLRVERPRVTHLPPIRTGATITSPSPEHRVGGELFEPLEELSEVYAALVLGTRDYVEKNGFGQVTFGLSGGIDSALVALVAVDALGADRVKPVTMPSRYSSAGTRSDAERLAENLGCELLTLPIAEPMDAFDAVLAETFASRDADLTEENLQARIRGNLLMALSNKFGWLVLTCGNKSEMSTGYSTLYGDSAGGFAVIKDVPKTLVYRLVEHRAHRDPQNPVPEEIVTRPPSAELRHEQRDDDSLPPYDVLDPILEGYVEEDLGRDQLVALGLPAADVERVIRLVDLAEYKRRQMPPGIKITPRAFGRDRRLPIVNRYGG
ncbi:MAG: synthetase [Solirubrobacterales bacterium]|jgi:NAD+ synthase (glutamine-hydrolysing)|nr:synthetase [Solirubrobacterales bacterium]